MLERLRYFWMRLRGRYDLASYTAFLRSKYGYRYNYLDINEDFDICEFHYRKRRSLDRGELPDQVKRTLHDMKRGLYTSIGLRGMEMEELEAKRASSAGKTRYSAAAALQELILLKEAFDKRPEKTIPPSFAYPHKD